MSSRREKRFLKLKTKFDNETLSLIELESLTNDHIIEYCKRVLSKRHNVQIHCDCKDCLVVSLFKIPRRTISDRQLQKLTYPDN